LTDEISIRMEQLASQFKYSYDWYVALTRGGLVPACFLSQITDQRKIDTLVIYSYKMDKVRGGVVVIIKDYSHIKNQKVLIVDDIVDSGNTMKRAKLILSEQSPEVLETAVVLKKSCSQFEPDYFIHEVDASKWIDFSWERNVYYVESTDIVKEYEDVN